MGIIEEGKPYNEGKKNKEIIRKERGQDGQRSKDGNEKSETMRK